ncbi:MAG: histidinol-phosphate transaminase [Planctomycetota bacterium]
MTGTGIQSAAPTPNPGIERAYGPQKPLAPCDLWLGGNEGRPPQALDVPFRSEALGRYPSTASLSRAFASKLGVEEANVLVTAGADDALLRIALAYLGAGREIVLPTPTFEMIPRYARVAGGTIVDVPWEADTPYPTDAVIAAVTPDTSVVAIVSPNNPTGAVATSDDVRRVAEAAPHALVVVDQAYAEFADEDLAPAALAQSNAVVLRTMSKAYGCAGLRVGFAIGEPDVLETLRAAGNPYPVAAPSLAAAERRLAANVGAIARIVREERRKLAALLQDLGLRAAPSQGNFVFARSDRAVLIRDLVAGLGVGIRAFPGVPGLEDALRITCPGDPRDFERLTLALRCALAPDTLLFADGAQLEGGDVIRERLASEYRIADIDGATDPAEALRASRGKRAWMLCSTCDEVAAARRARVLPIGFAAEGADGKRTALATAGAGVCVQRADDLEEILP